MHRARLRTIAMTVGVLVALVVWVAVAERVAARGKIYHRVEVAGADVSGLTTDDAVVTLASLAPLLETEPWIASNDETEFSLDPVAIDYEIDPAATVEAARAQGRTRNPMAQIWGTIQRAFRTDEVALESSWDQERLDEILDVWSAALADGLSNGGLEFEGATVIEIEPQDGRGMLRSDAADAIDDALHSAARNTIPLKVGETTPEIDAEEVARAAAEARAILAEPVVVELEGAEVAIAPEELGSTMNARARGARLMLGIDTDLLGAILAPTVAPYETPPVEATFAVDGATVSVVPSVTGRVLDIEAVADEILACKHRVTGQLVDAEPERDTAWAQSLNITDLVSTYTTNYPAGQPRVRNIQRAAEIVNNTIVEPGAVFSLNDTIGPRTPEAGFVEAPAFSEEDGFFETYGGGVSQFSTTMLNTTFFSGYEILEFTPHSIYISRYPMGREATLDYPSIDNVWRNDTDSGVLIRSSAGATSVTVTYYGNVGGRTVEAEGPNIIREIPVEEKITETDFLEEGDRVAVPGEGGFPGIEVENIRIIRRPGEPEERERYTWTYDMRPRQVLVGTRPRAPEPPPEEPPPEQPPPAPAPTPAPAPPAPPAPAAATSSKSSPWGDTVRWLAAPPAWFGAWLTPAETMGS